MIAVSKDQVTRLWLHLQGFSKPRGSDKFTKTTLSQLLNQVGGLQLDTINVVERAHLLTLWSRFGSFDREEFQRWAYRDGLAYEYWGHEACILPIAHLPLGKVRMNTFPPSQWEKSAWFKQFVTSNSSKRRVIRRLREEGALESKDFETSKNDKFHDSWIGMSDAALPVGKEDKRTLQLFWHAGKVAVRDRRHFRRLYDLADRVYPHVKAASRKAYEDSWLLYALTGNGITAERHLNNYFTAPLLTAAEKKEVILRNLKKRTIREVKVPGMDEARWFALPQHLELLDQMEEPHGTTFICPFDSLLWQRQRAEELLNFQYRIEIYVPGPKRVFGYYVLPILHNGQFVGRLDPKFHREKGLLEVKSLYFEDGFQRTEDFDEGFRRTLESLASFVGATDIQLR